MRARPDGLGEDDLSLALAQGWRIEAADLRYAAVGGGSYHWVVQDGPGRRWFVTVDDLDDKAWLGQDRPAVLAGLRSALETALALREDAGLTFVAAPVRGCDGAVARTVGGSTQRGAGGRADGAGPRYALAVFPYLSGDAGRWGQVSSAAERTALVDMLAALHEARPVAGARMAAIGLPRREALDAALRDLGRPWRSGPFAEPVRALLAGTRDQVAGAGSRRYARLTGRAVDPAALAWYRLRWALDDISSFVNRLRTEHRRTADTEHAWLALKETVERARIVDNIV